MPRINGSSSATMTPVRLTAVSMTDALSGNDLRDAWPVPDISRNRHARIKYDLEMVYKALKDSGLRPMVNRTANCHPAGISRTLTPVAPCGQMNATGRTTMPLKIERFQPEGMNVRMSGGQASYSHVVTVSGTGKLVYTAGQLARDIDGNCVGKGDMRAQMEQTFQNLDRCLKAAGATWADVVKTNTFVTDFDEFQKCGDIRMRYLGVATPTSTTVGVTRLAGPDFMIEIEAVAVVNS